MRKSLIIYSLLLPFLLVSSARIAAAMSDANSNTQWDNPVATASETGDDENGVSVDNLVTTTPLFDAVISYVLPIQESVHWNLQGTDRYDPPSLVTRNRKFRI